MSNTTDNVGPSWSNNCATKHKNLNYLTETEMMQRIHTDILEDSGDSSTANDELSSDNDIDDSIFQDSVDNVAVINPQPQRRIILPLNLSLPHRHSTRTNHPAGIIFPGPQPTVNVQPPQQPRAARGRRTIWQGLLEWTEKPKNSNDPQKVIRHVPCQVCTTTKVGEPELKANGWPAKMIMQLMHERLIDNIGGAYLENPKCVLFHPQNCEALDSLTRIMTSGYAGFVHFTSASTPSTSHIKMLILLYIAQKRAYLGFIPNDQVAFVDRFRRVVQQERSAQMLWQSQQQQYRQQLMDIPARRNTSEARPQIDQQMANNSGGNPQQPSDDVGNFE